MYIFIDKIQDKAHFFASYSHIADHLHVNKKTIYNYMKQKNGNKYENSKFVIYIADKVKVKLKPRGNKYNLNAFR